MTTVVEVAQSSAAVAIGSASVAFSTTPAPGDVVVAVIGVQGSYVLSSITGLGASWVEGYRVSEISGFSHVVMIGTGANASGNVSISGTARAGTLTAFLVRGLSGTGVVADTVRESSVVTSTGPSQTAGNGQFVLDAFAGGATSGNIITFPSTPTPASGWTSQAHLYDSNNRYNFGSTYRLPTTSETHQVGMTSNMSTHSRITQLVIGSVVALGATGTVAATAPAPSASVQGTVTLAGQVAATAPSPTLSVAGNVPTPAITGTVAATAPSPTLAVAGNVPGATSGTVTATAPSPTLSVTGTLPTPVTGTVSATAPSPTLRVSESDEPMQSLVSGFAFGSSLTSGVVSLQRMESGFGFGSRLKQSRDWGVVAGETRPSPLVVITGRNGAEPRIVLDEVSIAPLETGVGVIDGWRFSVDRDNPRGKRIEPVTHEAHLYRGNYLMSKGPIGPGRLENGRMVYDVSDPRWYLNTGRRIGRIPTLNWIYNGDFTNGTAGWTGAFKEGSIPEAKPEFYVVDEPESTSGKGLRIEGVDKVVTTVKNVETAAVFVANEATYLPGGAATLIAGAADIPDGATIHIVGHTADRRAYGDDGDGLELSKERAQAARATLAAHNPTWTFTLLPGLKSPNENDGVVAGRGYYEQVASNSTESESAKNRRVALHYATTQTATGHRQYVAQRRYNVVQEVDMLVPLEVIVVGRMRIGEWLGAPADGNAMRVVLVDLETGEIAVDPETGSAVESTAKMSAATPRVKVQEYSASVKVPADGRTYYISVELYPPAGWSVWSDVQMLPQEQRGYFDMDQALIVRDLTLHVQDTHYGHGDLGIGTRTPLTGVLRTKEYAFSQRWPWSTAIEGLTSLARGVEVDFDCRTNEVVTYYPRQGSVAGMSLSHGGPRSSVKAYRPLPASGRNLASSLIVQAWGFNSSRIERHARDEAAFGGALLEDVIEAEEESSPNELDELATQHLARSIHPTAAWEVVIDSGLTSKVLDEIGKGDRVLLSLPDEGVHSLHRMVSRTWDPETDTLTLQLAPEEAS